MDALDRYVIDRLRRDPKFRKHYLHNRPRWSAWCFRRGCMRLDGLYYTARKAKEQIRRRKIQGYTNTELHRKVR